MLMLTSKQMTTASVGLRVSTEERLIPLISQPTTGQVPSFFLSTRTGWSLLAISCPRSCSKDTSTPKTGFQHRFHSSVHGFPRSQTDSSPFSLSVRHGSCILVSDNGATTLKADKLFVFTTCSKKPS